MEPDKIVIVRDKTRLEQLVERFNSKAQAKFYLERSGQDFGSYEKEHAVFYTALKEVEKGLAPLFKCHILLRPYLPTYLFTERDLVVVIGQDGLVANTAKYVNGLPIVGINPDRERYDGILLPHGPRTCCTVVSDLIKGRAKSKKVTMAQALTNDGQSLLAFNDFYIGAASHVSSRYSLEFAGKTENQSSSGILVSTGAGSTGWISSVFNMVRNVHGYHQKGSKLSDTTLPWEANRLLFVVREPFHSKTTKTGIGYGSIDQGSTLRITSQMTTKGVIFSDGVESDFIHFNSGCTVTIGIADQKANLIL